MRKSLKEKLNGGQFINVPPTRSKSMSSVRGKGNKSTELKLRMALIRAGISGWNMNVSELAGHPDFYFPNIKLAIFVDGCFWHGCPKHGHLPNTRNEYWKAKIQSNKRRDREVRNQLRCQDVSVLRIWEHSMDQTTRIINKILLILNHEA